MDPLSSWRVWGTPVKLTLPVTELVIVMENVVSSAVRLFYLSFFISGLYLLHPSQSSNEK